jgi:pimeloyl-ACP methyl ester carboxylesterase
MVALLMTACSATGTGADRGAAAGLAWNACGDGLVCATVAVPLNWSMPSGPTITLALAKYPADSGASRLGSLFFNPGGPGVSGVDALRQRGKGLAALGGGRFDVVSWDPRGTGASTAIRCFRDDAAKATFYGSRPVPSDPSGQTEFSIEATGFARECGAVSGDLLEHVSTADTVRDLDRLRQLVGDQELTYLGESYGTFLGETYANMFPTRVRAMVLDSIIDPASYVSSAQQRVADTMTDTNAVVAEFERSCESAGPARCALAGAGPVTGRVANLIDRLKQSPVPAPATPGSLTYGDALVALYTYLGSPAEWPSMARDVARALAGDGSGLLNRARSFSKTLADILPPAAGLGCADSPARADAATWPRRLDRFTALSPIYGPLLTWWLWAPCAAWPARSAAPYEGPWNASTKSPVLVVGTTFDPNTPFQNAQNVAKLLGKAVLLTHDGYGHTSASDPSACVTRAAVVYFVSLDVPAGGTVCPSDRLPFDPQFGE